MKSFWILFFVILLVSFFCGWKPEYPGENHPSQPLNRPMPDSFEVARLLGKRRWKVKGYRNRRRSSKLSWRQSATMVMMFSSWSLAMMNASFSWALSHKEEEKKWLKSSFARAHEELARRRVEIFCCQVFFVYVPSSATSLLLDPNYSNPD